MKSANVKLDTTPLPDDQQEPLTLLEHSHRKTVEVQRTSNTASRDPILSGINTFDLDEPIASAGLPAVDAQRPKPPPSPLQAIVSEAELAADLERKLRQSVALLSRTAAELETERGERRRAEQRAISLSGQLQKLHQEFGNHLQIQQLEVKRCTELEQELASSKEALERATAQLKNEIADLQLAEEQLRVLEDLPARLETDAHLLEEARRIFKHAEAEMQARFEDAKRELADLNTRLQQETRERQRLEEFLSKAQRELREQSENSRAEMSRLESTRHVEQLERRGADAEKLRSMCSALDSARESYTVLQKLREQVQPSVDTLHATACRLLKGGLSEPHKQLAEDLLEEILVLRMTVQGDGWTSESRDGAGPNLRQNDDHDSQL